MSQVSMKIEGMSCKHCVMQVRKAVSALDGVTEADVNVGTAKVSYDATRVSKDDLKRAVENAGYRVTEQGGN